MVPLLAWGSMASAGEYACTSVQACSTVGLDRLPGCKAAAVSYRLEQDGAGAGALRWTDVAAGSVQIFDDIGPAGHALVRGIRAESDDVPLQGLVLFDDGTFVFQSAGMFSGAPGMNPFVVSMTGRCAGMG